MDICKNLDWKFGYFNNFDFVKNIIDETSQNTWVIDSAYMSKLLKYWTDRYDKGCEMSDN